MSTDPGNRRSSLIDILKAVGAIVALPLALFALANSIVAQPIIALGVALVTAVLVSAWVVRSGWTGTTEMIVTWLTLTVVVLAGFVIWPKTVRVEGRILDTAGTPVSYEKVVLVDVNGVIRETRTDADGYYRFNGVPHGEYSVRVREYEAGGKPSGVFVSLINMDLIVSQPIPTPTPTNIPTPAPTNTPTPTPTPPIVGETGVYCIDSGSGGTEIFAVEPPRTIAQIRIDLEERATEFGFSLWEVEAYGPDTDVTNLVTGGEARASSAQDSAGCIGCFAELAIDGDMNTRWSSDWRDPQWLEITLPEPQVVNRIVLRWETAYASKYCMTVITPPIPGPPTPMCLITEPANGSENLGYSNEVSAMCSDVPDSRYVWVLVYPHHDFNYYPQPGPIGSGSGQYNSGMAYLGTETEGFWRQFDIIVVLSDEAANTILQSAAISHTGWPDLPSGVEEMDRVTVRRGRSPETPMPTPTATTKPTSPPAFTGKVCQIKSGWDANTIFLRQAEFDALGLPIGTKVTIVVRDTGRSVENMTLSLDSRLEICTVRLAKPLRQALGVDTDTAIEPERDRPNRQFDITPTSPPTNEEKTTIQGRICMITGDQDTKTVFLRQAEFDAFGVPAGTTVSVTVLDTGRTVENVTLGLGSDIATCVVRLSKSLREALAVAGDTDIDLESRPDRQISIRLP